MKKYRAKLKDTIISGQVRMPGGGINTVNDGCRCLRRSLNSDAFFGSKDGHGNIEFTQGQLDKFDADFLQLLDIEEVKEELYKIVFPYVDGNGKFLNISPFGTVLISNEDTTIGYITSFTMEQIRKDFPKLEQFAVKVVD